MKATWLRWCEDFAAKPAEFCHNKIKGFSDVILTISGNDWRKNDLSHAELGYTDYKIEHLRNHYWNDDAIKKASHQWKKLIEGQKSGSVSFKTQNPTSKGHNFCIEEIRIFYDVKKQSAIVDLSYRVGELFRRVPADFMLIDEILDQFDFSNCSIQNINFNFKQLSLNPAFSITPAVASKEPTGFYKKFQNKDPNFFGRCMRPLHDLLTAGSPIAHHQSSQRLRRHVLPLLEELSATKILTKFCEEQQTGWRAKVLKPKLKTSIAVE